ncbi:hypothetical protein A3H85_00685 [Candidatus Daviesbacteria bacterium RIFCSPLOWO2_02_FULL_40_8]|nr:MAG: hypothetical protein A3H85_00685 [Candidatus Daviesbacteria bacterium RIFCSPLOWO2_02_FULL_40_8]
MEGQRKPLQERYANILNTLKSNQTTAENRQTIATANELGRRGIVGGGLYEQEFANALNPITQQYSISPYLYPLSKQHGYCLPEKTP